MLRKGASEEVPEVWCWAPASTWREARVGRVLALRGGLLLEMVLTKVRACVPGNYYCEQPQKWWPKTLPATHFAYQFVT